MSHATPWVPESYPAACRSNHVDIYKSTSLQGEVSVPDPYQYLEEHLQETEEFTSRQADFTRKYLDQNPNLTRLEDAFKSCNDYAKFYAPQLRDDGKYYWFYNSGLDAQTSSDRNDPVYHEGYIRSPLPATLQYYVVPSSSEDLSSNSAGYWLPSTSPKIGYTGPLHLTAEYGADRGTLFPDQPSFFSNEDGRQNNLYETPPLGNDFSAPELEPVEISYWQLHRRLLQFLMANPSLLQNAGDSTPHSMARLQLDFEVDLQHGGPLPPFAEINKIFQQFQPVIGSPAIRQESNSRMTTSATKECPFQSCGGRFTRLTGLQNHLSAHFRLTPKQCPRCSKGYSDVAFRRHVDNCRKTVRHFTAY